MRRNFSQGAPRPFFFRCPQASGCDGFGPVEAYAVRWVQGDGSHNMAGAASEADALKAAHEFLREGARCACVSLRLFEVRS